jgi:hypothetical protein
VPEKTEKVALGAYTVEIFTKVIFYNMENAVYIDL